MESKITIIKNEKSWIESNAVEQLHKVAELEGITKAVGLPDLHLGKTPVGASYLVKDYIYPHIVGNDIGCGMALFETGLKKKKFKADKIINKLEGIDGIENIDITSFIEAEELPFKDKLGTIGSGNHFAELQEIEEVYDKEALKDIAMEKENVYLLVHSGSRSYGEHILRKYIEEYSCQNGLKVDSEGFNNYLIDHEKALYYAKLNRELIAYRILETINAKENKKLLDSVHNGITHKVIEGESFYIHRKGAAPSDIGCIVIAGTRGSSSYIVKPKENLLNCAFSVSHGAGRKWARFGCKEKLENVHSKKSIRENKLAQNLVYRDKSVIYEEAPEAYKNIDNVIEVMIEENMIELVAKLKPLVTYKC